MGWIGRFRVWISGLGVAKIFEGELMMGVWKGRLIMTGWLARWVDG